MTETRIFTAANKVAAIRREIGMRRRVYPRWVEQGKLTQAKADVEIAVFEAIETDYAEQVQSEQLL